MELRNKLNAIKEKHSLTNDSWSDLSGVPRGTISNILSGRTERPAVQDIMDMLRCVDESADELFDMKKPPEQPQEAAGAAEKTVEQHYHHHISVMPLRSDMREIAKEAIENAHSSDVYRSVHSNMVWWRWIAIALIALIICWFTWDITHPNVGLIQYGAVPTSLSSMADAVRTII